MASDQRAGEDLNLIGQGMPQVSTQEVNNDGLTDLLVHVKTDALEISEEDTDAVLSASADMSGDGVADTIIRGVDVVH